MKTKVYLTKSAEISEVIRTAYAQEIGKSHVVATHHFKLHQDDRIPAIYHDQGYWCNIIEYDVDANGYEIIFG